MFINIFMMSTCKTHHNVGFLTVSVNPRSCQNKSQENRRRAQWPRLVFRMELSPDVERVTFEFQNDHSLARFVMSDKVQSIFLQLRNELRVHFVTMTVTLVNDWHSAVQFACAKTQYKKNSHFIDPTYE